MPTTPSETNSTQIAPQPALERMLVKRIEMIDAAKYLFYLI